MQSGLTIFSLSFRRRLTRQLASICFRPLRPVWPVSCPISDEAFDCLAERKGGASLCSHNMVGSIGHLSQSHLSALQTEALPDLSFATSDHLFSTRAVWPHTRSPT
ncbi:unnamed protein product [Protopolystoma xenopodis]|uniref:Uncharacterized protein n=1 Tax=Protopolystoma xenopodis TaxID=117903 RepID=A0A3S5AXY1_9PLAT|nr:unnamed protein product [Protopolystoma xenopodis]